MKKFLSIFLTVALSLGLVMARPFDIYADTISNVNIVSYTKIIDLASKGETTSIPAIGGTYSVANWQYNLGLDLIFDDEYVGYANIIVNYSYSSYTYDSSNQAYAWTNNNYQTSHYVYINGNSAHWQEFINAKLSSTIGFSSSSAVSINSVSVGSSNVVQMSTLSSLSDIVNILNDINNYVSIDQYSELQNIAYNLDISNDYLEEISNMQYYNYPFESYGFIYQLLKYSKYHPNDLYISNIIDSYYYSYPLIHINSNQDRFYDTEYLNANVSYTCIFAINQNVYSYSLLNNYITFDNNFVLDSFNYIFRTDSSNPMTYITLKFHSSSNGRISFNSVSEFDIIPIYSNKSSFNNISTDFALMWGLSNNLLDDLHIVAQGTQQSNTSSSNLENENSDLSTSNSALFTQENSFNSSMNTNLNAINTNVDIGNFGQVFLGSANWVRTQFDNLTYSTPYGSILGYSLLLGLGLLIIGKVVK